MQNQQLFKTHVIRLCSFSNIRSALKPVVLGKPPYHDACDDGENNCEKDNEAEDNGALALSAFTGKP
jgi:hypothetical protein